MNYDKPAGLAHPLATRREFAARGATLAAALLLPSVTAHAATRMTVGYSGVTDYVTMFVGVEEGLFAKRGLEIEPKLIPLNPTIIPGIQSGSLQAGGPTTPAYLLAVDAGLDHVVIGGGGTSSKRFTDVGLVARAGSGIRTPADCEGKKIGVPGIGALLHVTLRHWLKLNKVDYKKITFIETPFPQHADLIRAGTVDAVLTLGPFLKRIIESSAGYVVSYYTTFLPEGYPSVVHTVKREWAAENPAAVKAFRETLVEAAAFMAKPENDKRVRAAAGKWLKLPAEIAATMQISPPLPVVAAKHLEWWGSIMKDQNMLKTDIAYDNLIVKA